MNQPDNMAMSTPDSRTGQRSAKANTDLLQKGLLIALIGPFVGNSWELSIAALFRDGMVLHTFLESSMVAGFALLGSIGCPSASAASKP